MNDPIDEPDPSPLDEDLVRVWTLAANADLDDSPGAGQSSHAGGGPDPARMAARAQRHQRYAREVLRTVGADPDRLVELVERCRRRLAEAGLPTAGTSRAISTTTGGSGDDAAGLWVVAVELLERASAMIAAADVTGPRGREELEADLYRERHPDPVPEPEPGLWDRHRWPRRAARRLNLAWWIRRWSAAVRVELVAGPFPSSAGPQRLIVLRLPGQQLGQDDGQDGGQVIGRFGYSLCHVCRLGWVAKLEVDPRWQDRGLGARALAAARAEGGAGYTWVTTGQFVNSRSFWRRIGHVTGAGYTAAPGAPCAHLAEPRREVRLSDDGLDLQF